MRPPPPHDLPAGRFPVEPWKLVETEFHVEDQGTTETIFAVGNGYLGMRGNAEEGRPAFMNGTFVNGFHETWPIQHAEEAFGFAKTGQTRVNAPDMKVVRLFVDDEPLRLDSSDVYDYRRTLDFRTGRLTRHLVWRTASGKRVEVSSSRLVSLVHRHLGLITFDVRMLDGAGPVTISSELLDREAVDEAPIRDPAVNEGLDPRRSRDLHHRVLVEQARRHDAEQTTLEYRCAHSGMTLACGFRHVANCDAPYEVGLGSGPDSCKVVFTTDLGEGGCLGLTKFVAYHSAVDATPGDLADRCSRALSRAVADGADTAATAQREWLDRFWERTDVEVWGNARDQQAMRWNLFQLAQATAQTGESGVSAKGVTGAGYEGHYFWDSEIYVQPFVAYTSPETARSLLRFRWHTLPIARQRSVELSQRGALYPWRTINGEEASAYYAAGTAQYHINAAVALAVKRYVDASNDLEYLAREGAEILVETARLWEDLGFYDDNGGNFHIHGVTGPDEYTAVVNDNLYTNVMARFNLSYAVETLDLLLSADPEGHRRLTERVGLHADEPHRWSRAAAAMYIPYDDKRGIHPQDASFLERERWDFANTPADRYPLLLHYHPLVIYRFQVLKQADVVLAMVLQRDTFSDEQRRRNFDYYDALTTGDSSLSACVQALSAAQIGYEDAAIDYFRQALFVDLADTHGNSGDGVHIASAAGVWSTVAFGFAGLRATPLGLTFSPRLPAAWDRIRFRMQHHGTRLLVDLDDDGCEVHVLGGPAAQVVVEDHPTQVGPGQSVRIPRCAGPG